MAFRGIRPDEVREYISPNDPDPDQPTVWKLGTLDAHLMGYIKDAVTRFETGGKKGSQTLEPVFRMGTWNWLLVKYGLRGWSNFLDHAGQPIVERFDSASHFGRSYQVVPDAVLEQLLSDLLTELANEINAQNTLQEAEKVPFG